MSSGLARIQTSVSRRARSWAISTSRLAPAVCRADASNTAITPASTCRPRERWLCDRFRHLFRQSRAPPSLEAQHTRHSQHSQRDTSGSRVTQEDQWRGAHACCPAPLRAGVRIGGRSSHDRYPASHRHAAGSKCCSRRACRHAAETGLTSVVRSPHRWLHTFRGRHGRCHSHHLSHRWNRNQTLCAPHGSQDIGSVGSSALGWRKTLARPK